MEITQGFLRNKFDYCPETDAFHYKYDANKRSDWNDKFTGQEVKPVLSGGKKYLFVCDALYSYPQLISIWEGENRRLIKKTAIELTNENAKLLTGLKQLPINEIKSISKGLLSNKLSVSSVVKKVKKGTTKAIKYFDTNDVAAKPATGLPSHIYLHPDSKKYYVKVTYQGQSSRKAGIETYDEALEIRNYIYAQLEEAEKKGVDMSNFKVSFEDTRMPPANQTRFDNDYINPKTNLPRHIYLRKDSGKYRVLIPYKGKDYTRGANTYEEALQIRNELYEVLNNGKSADNTRN